MHKTIETHLAVIVSYFGATNTQGSRVKLTLPRFKKYRAFPFDYESGSTTLQAIKTLGENGINVLSRAELDDHKTILMVEWENDFTNGNVAKFFNIK